MSNYTRGAEWRRWELHIHTPGTLKNDNFTGVDLGQKWENYYSDIDSYIDENNPLKQVAVIAVTDYLSIDNYLDVKAKFEACQLNKSIKLILPNVELRISPVTGSETPINIHCIFSPDIDSELESRFFGKLRFSDGNTSYSATKSELVRFGRAFVSGQNIDESRARNIAAEQFVISFSVLKEVFDNDKELRDKTIIVVSNKTGDGASGLRNHSDYFIKDGTGNRSQLQAVRRSIYKLSDAIFSSNAKDIDYFVGNGIDTREEVISTCGSLKPCFHGSDAHENAKIFEPEGKRYCWIKADPTFDGLLQAINEPVDRVFIGESPDLLERVNSNRTKYIKEIHIDTIEGKHDTTNVWFKNIQIPINPELVAIIGNKGSGKSAISDIIGLCADAEHYEDFIFLNKHKFLKKGFAERFCARLAFNSGTATDTRPLSYAIKNTDSPKVQYLPQNYFETVCNEIGKIEHFKREIEKVVFQYLSEDKKLRKKSFKELIEFKKECIDSEIDCIKLQIEALNKEIILLENKKNPEYRNSLVSKSKIKQEELRVHLDQKPIKSTIIEQSSEAPETNSQRSQLEQLADRKVKLTEQLDKMENEVLDLTLEIEELKQLKRDIESKVEDTRKFIDDKEALAEKYTLNITQIISVSYDTSTIDSAIVSKCKKLEDTKSAIGTEDIINGIQYDQLPLKGKIAFCVKEMATINSKLSSKEQEYQDYLENIRKWEEKKIEIEGNKDKVDSVEYYNYEINYVDNILDSDLNYKRNQRMENSKSIYQKKLEIKAIYDEIKSEIDLRLNECQDQELTIDSSFSLATDFVDTFMNHINKSKVGSFRGQDDGKKVLQEKLLSSLDWNQQSAIENLLTNTISYLEKDKRCSDESCHISTFIGDQVPKRNEFYTFLFALDYLEPHYELRQNGKRLDELSPGEKGALLLVFYLVLDKSEIPLLIDQPEDNLDNHSVAKVLVPFIRKAKTRRQIIMVTHNPNLAVVADAEQIVYVDIDKTNGNQFNFSSGSIEDMDINSKIVNVLEGTMPAFSTRKRKYYE